MKTGVQSKIAAAPERPCAKANGNGDRGSNTIRRSMRLAPLSVNTRLCCQRMVGRSVLYLVFDENDKESVWRNIASDWRRQPIAQLGCQIGPRPTYLTGATFQF